MELKGGVLIIGSLIWENHLKQEKKDYIRRNWRQTYLSGEQVTVHVPIRYGRKSSTRKDTYTMIFSLSCANTLGQGIIKPFAHPVLSFEQLEEQAIALAIAEGIYRDTNRRLTTSWGSVGILFNPELATGSLAIHALLHGKWSKIYNEYRDTLFPEDYALEGDARPTISKDGILQIAWHEDLDDFDFLLATPVVPDPKLPLTPADIADKMNTNKYWDYFKNNRANNILTFQDDAILVRHRP